MGLLHSIDLVEAHVIVEGVLLAQEMGFHPFLVESDSQRIIHLLNLSIDNLSKVGSFLSEFQQSHDPRRCSFGFTQSGNEATHQLAQLALRR